MATQATQKSKDKPTTLEAIQERPRIWITIWLLALLSVLVLGVVIALVTPYGHSAFAQGKYVIQVAFASLGVQMAFVSRYYFRVVAQGRAK
jgi:hypothetical protein